MSKVVITYVKPDLDCVASAYAYAEFLNKKGEEVSYFIKGDAQKEVDIVCSMFGIELKNQIDDVSNSDVIVVDTNKLSDVSYVRPEQIVEVIDHHPETNDEFPNATKVDVQEIGAVCTIIAEYFKDQNIDISRESAILLYYGIVSNTVNFYPDATKQRDLDIAAWLKEKCGEISDDYIKKIFEEKSKIDIENLRSAMEVEQTFSLDNDVMIIGQLEIAEAKEFLDANKIQIDKVLADAKEEHKVPIIFMNMVDILNGYHMIYTPYKESEEYLKEFGYTSFIDGVCTKPNMLLRKQVKKAMKDVRTKRNEMGIGEKE